MGSSREALEHAIRRSLAFHLAVAADETSGQTLEDEQQEQERELLATAFVDSAESGTLRDTAAVEQEFDDYLPDAGLPSPQRQELFDDVLRDTLKYFPLSAFDELKEEGKDGDEGASEDEMDPGCCVLCERFMPLTRHHVMPKSTHKRYRKKGYTDAVLNRTIDICRPCHSAVHRAHDALTLAERFTTREELLADETVGRFAAWARKQRTTSSQDAKNNLLRYRR